MCTSQHVYHRCCRSWGRNRLDPCIRSLVVDGHYTGCAYIESLGSVDTDDLCFQCERKASGDKSFELFKRSLPILSVRHAHAIKPSSCSVTSSNDAQVLLVLGRRHRDHVIAIADSGF
ncbi:hypothetical protein PMIN01_01227 [Paraphaeosphaeria minitans]|uniref:Uncharacterized protein n=1 Tax=Paraphaeosphaeria minitans TaxID=565426 RepID=A0A9P6GUV5_9PLEO|nr:hypothetical protein PMIN01_01227 [Paraphaeosphaeria minitans]